jgi:hypothetical protein
MHLPVVEYMSMQHIIFLLKWPRQDRRAPASLQVNSKCSTMVPITRKKPKLALGPYKNANRRHYLNKQVGKGNNSLKDFSFTGCRKKI